MKNQDFRPTTISAVRARRLLPMDRRAGQMGWTDELTDPLRVLISSFRETGMVGKVT